MEKILDESKASSGSESDDDYVPSGDEDAEGSPILLSKKNKSRNYDSPVEGETRENQKNFDNQVQQFNDEKTETDSNVSQLWSSFVGGAEAGSSREGGDLTKKENRVIEPCDNVTEGELRPVGETNEAYLNSGDVRKSGNSCILAKRASTGTLLGPRKSGGGLSGALGTITKRQKLSTLEKSKLDWNDFKSGEDHIYPENQILGIEKRGSSTGIMSQVLTSSSSTNEGQDFASGKIPADAVILAPDSEGAEESDGISDSDIIPPSQDAYDVLPTGAETKSKAEGGENEQQQVSALDIFNGRSIFGTSAPTAPDFHSWQTGIDNQVEEKIQISGGQEQSLQNNAPSPTTALKADTVSTSLDSDSVVPESCDSEKSHVVPVHAESNGDFSLRLSELPESQRNVESQSVITSDETAEAETTIKPEGNTVAKEVDYSPEGDGNKNFADENPDFPMEELDKDYSPPGESDGNKNFADENPDFPMEELDKDYPSDDDPDNSSPAVLVDGGEDETAEKRKRKLTKKEKAQLMVEGRRSAREGREKQRLGGTQETERPKRGEDKRGRLSGERRATRSRDNMNFTTPQGAEKRILRSSGVRGQDGESESSSSAQTRSSRRQVVRRSAVLHREAERKKDRPVRTQHSTPKLRNTKHRQDPRKTQSERKPPQVRKRRRALALPQPDLATSDPYDIDDVDLDQDHEPLKHIHVTKAFGDIRFSKGPTTENQGTVSKYARLEKSVELRRQSQSFSGARMDDTSPTDYISDIDLTPPQSYRVRIHQRTFVDRVSPRSGRIVKSAEIDRRTYQKETRHLSPRQRRRLSPDKSTPSSGNLGDVSSLDTNKSSSGTYPASTPSSGSVGKSRSGRLSGGLSRSRRKSDKSSTGTNDGSYSLFSDVEPLNESGEKVVDEKQSGQRDTNTRRQKKLDTTEKQSFGGRSKRRRSVSVETVPKKSKPTYSRPELDSEKQLEVDCQTPHGAPFPIGTRVLAAWKDKNYYPGHVVEIEGFGRYKVMFLDGALRDMPQPDIVPVARLKTGDTLMVDATAEGELQPVTIQKCPETTKEQWHECAFHVYNQAKEENERICWERLVIDVQQKKDFVSTSVNVAAENVSPGNISGGRERRTRPAIFSAEISTPRRGRGATSGVGSSGTKGRGAPTLKPEHNNTEQSISSVQKVGEKDDVPFKQIFDGMKFVLTSANRKAKTDFGSDSDEERPTVQFIKKNVRQMIEDRGGTVIDDFSQVVSAENLFLVADTHYRTHKYLSALARAIPCVSHIWIHNCCATNQKEDHKHYMLPAGISLERECLIDWHDECPRLLKDMKVMVHTENRPQSRSSLDFVQIWAPLVKCMGAKLVDSLPEEGRLDMLLTDASCQLDFLERAKDLGAFTVSSEWLIQAIITGTRPDPDSHRKYRYDYVENQMGMASSGDSNPN